jgi:hypothetical protein
MIRIVSLDCWHSNEILYQAEGRTDDGRHAYVRYRRPWFSVGVHADPDEAPGVDTFVTDAHPDHDPSTIRLRDLKAWTAEGGTDIVWALDRITGFDNEPRGPAPSGDVPLGEG